MDVCAAARWSGWFDDLSAPFVHVDPAAYLSLAVGHGLDPVTSAVHDEIWRFDGLAAFRVWCTVGFADWTARLPAGERADWVADVADRYALITGDPSVFRFYQQVVELRRRG